MTIIPFPERHEGCGGRAKGWLTLPVAPRAAARSCFCRDEKLPQAMEPQAALAWFEGLPAKGKMVSGVVLDGPGDPLAMLAPTLATLKLVREKHPELPMGLTTLGFGLAEGAVLLAGHGISRVTLLMDALDPEVMQRLYLWIRPGRRNVPLAKACATLIEEQARGIAACKAAGIEVFVRTTVYEGVNEQEVEAIARHIKGLGVESLILVPGRAGAGNEEAARLPDEKTMQACKESAARHVEVVELPETIVPVDGTAATITGVMPRPTSQRPNVAVVSSSGMDIDLHLGEAITILIYGPRGEDGLACLLENRPAPEPGGGAERWQKLAASLPDCFCLLAASAGENPRRILGQQGITVLISEAEIGGAVDLLYGGGKKKNKTPR